MRLKNFTFVLFCLTCLLVGCARNQGSTLNKRQLLRHYTLPADSLKHQAVVFLLDNISTHTSDIPVFTDRRTGKEVAVDLLSMENYTALLETIWERNLHVDFKTVPDITIIDNDFLLRDLEHAFRLWNKYPWANNVPFDIFLNYLLPYKAFGEEPYDWRSFFTQKYEELVSKLLNSLEPDKLVRFDEIYAWLLTNGMGRWFVYTDDPISLTQYPGFRELMALKSGDCVGLSYLNVMLLRSLGVPATIDFAPVFGRQNAGHSTEMLWDSEQQHFRTVRGRRFMPPTKAFRYTFRTQNNWSNVIQPVVGDQPFLLEFLKNDHWKDVTHEHNHTATVAYEWEFTTNFAYICTFNFRQWVPAFWGKVENGVARFENMGADMLYRIAVPSGNSFELISSIFRLDREGNKTFFEPDTTNRIDMPLRARPGDRFIGAGVSYSLYYYAGNGNWNLFQTQPSEQYHLIVFEGVPTNTLYILQDNEHGGRVERIFTFENGRQVWW